MGKLKQKPSGGMATGAPSSAGARSRPRSRQKAMTRCAMKAYMPLTEPVYTAEGISTSDTSRVACTTLLACRPPVDTRVTAALVRTQWSVAQSPGEGRR